MSREKQIEEMAEAIFQNCNCGLFFSEAENIARFVIEEQGCRRQSEVIDEFVKRLKEEPIKLSLPLFGLSTKILEDYAEQLVKHGVQPVIQCEKCKYWKKYGYDPIIEKCWGECCRPFGEDGVTQETAENDFCSFAKEATYESLCK